MNFISILLYLIEHLFYLPNCIIDGVGHGECEGSFPGLGEVEEVLVDVGAMDLCQHTFPLHSRPARNWCERSACARQT